MLIDIFNIDEFVIFLNKIKEGHKLLQIYGINFNKIQYLSNNILSFFKDNGEFCIAFDKLENFYYISTHYEIRSGIGDFNLSKKQVIELIKNIIDINYNVTVKMRWM